MSLLSRENLLKAVAIIVILGFIIELFIVYSYTPAQQSPQTSAGQEAQAQRLQYSSVQMAPFTIREFTGTIYFVCNTTSTSQVATAVQGIPGLKGRPLEIGQTENGQLFLVQAENASTANTLTVSLLADRLAEQCLNEPVVFREATVYYNSSQPLQLVRVDNATETTSLSKRQFDSYTDQYGRSATALITDLLAIQGSSVNVMVLLTLQGGQIVPGSLVIEQPAVKTERRRITVTIHATILSLSSTGVALVSIPWQDRSNLSYILEALNSSGALHGTELDRISNVIIYNPTAELENRLRGNANIQSLASGSQGELIATFTDTFSNMTELESILTGFNYSLPLSAIAATVDFAQFREPELRQGYALTLYRTAEVALLEPVQNAEIPEQFEALVFSNQIAGQNVTLSAEVIIREGTAAVLRPRQVS